MIRKTSGGYKVLSEKGKNLGGPYKTKAEAEKRLQIAVNEVLTVADRAPSGSALTGSLRPVLQKYISFDAMTRRAVGPGWRQFTEDQQKKATQLFTTLIIRTYSSKLSPGEHPVIKFKAASAPAPGRAGLVLQIRSDAKHARKKNRHPQSRLPSTTVASRMH